MIGFPIEHPSFEWVFLWSVVHILFVVWLVFLWTSFLWIGLSMISSSYIWSWHIWFSYDQPFLYLRSYVCVPIFIHGINGLPISVHRIIGFLMNSLPIIAFLYLRSYDCVFLYPCLPVERGGSMVLIVWKNIDDEQFCCTCMPTIFRSSAIIGSFTNLNPLSNSF